MRARNRALAVVATATALSMAVTMQAEAATVSRLLVGGLSQPLGGKVSPDGSGYVSEAGTGTLTAVSRWGKRHVVAREVGGEITGVGFGPGGTVGYTASQLIGEDVSASTLAVLRPDGTTSVLADLRAYEQRVNPDAGASYGFLDLPPSCQAQLPPAIPGDLYGGLVDSHAYSVGRWGDEWVVGDAAGNDLLGVSATGTVRTIAVLPPQPVVLTSRAVDEQGLAACAVGTTYLAEPVPTDVQQGPDGMLYVSLLSGGPGEGAVYRVNPTTGTSDKLVGGLVGAVDLAVAPDGTVYVAELFADRISKIVDGVAVPFASVPQPGAVDWFGGKLYATVQVLQPHRGAIVTIKP